jgi:acetyltransferase-like isoleucine patch superfamily enzyme
MRCTGYAHRATRSTSLNRRGVPSDGNSSPICGAERNFCAIMCVKMPSAERRTAPRRTAHVALGLDTDDRKGRIGVSRDISMTGVLFASRSKFVPDETITVSVTALTGDRISINGKVIRSHPVDIYPWTHVTAVAFVEPATLLHAVVDEQLSPLSQRDSRENDA